MKLRTELPHFRAQCRDGAPWVIRLDQIDGFRREWMAGRAFWSGFDQWDQPLDVKLADITAVIVYTSDSIALGEEEDEEKKRRALVES